MDRCPFTKHASSELARSGRSDPSSFAASPDTSHRGGPSLVASAATVLDPFEPAFANRPSHPLLGPFRHPSLVASVLVANRPSITPLVPVNPRPSREVRHQQEFPLQEEAAPREVALRPAVVAADRQAATRLLPYLLLLSTNDKLVCLFVFKL